MVPFCRWRCGGIFKMMALLVELALMELEVNQRLGYTVKQE